MGTIRPERGNISRAADKVIVVFTSELSDRNPAIGVAMASVI